MADRLEQSNVTNETIARAGIEAQRAKRDVEEATGRYRNVIKRWKDEGVNVKALVSAINMRKADEETVRLDVRDTLRYAGILAPNLQLADQLELFRDENATTLKPRVADQLAEHEVESNGYAAGRGSEDKGANPHEPGTPHHVAWLRGWTAGQRSIADRMGRNAKAADGSRAKPARGGGSAAAASVPEEQEPEQAAEIEQAADLYPGEQQAQPEAA